MLSPLALVRTLAARYPDVVPLLSPRARLLAAKPTEYKTYDYFLSTLERMITNVYEGNLGGEFVDIMASLIQGQLTQAYEQAWKDEEGEGALPDYLTAPLEDLILSQYDHVDQLYRDIVDARVDETDIAPLLSRAALWAERWNEAYNQAVLLITSENGGNLVWRLGATEEHCEVCSALNGVIAPASVWDELGVHPQGAPNDLLTCGGWRCDCSLESTTQRRSPKAYDAILNAVGK